VKAESGITFAQEPSSAKFDGMPRSAIAADDRIGRDPRGIVIGAAGYQACWRLLPLQPVSTSFIVNCLADSTSSSCFQLGCWRRNSQVFKGLCKASHEPVRRRRLKAEKSAFNIPAESPNPDYSFGARKLCP
jgi:hypothetical protein